MTTGDTEAQQAIARIEDGDIGGGLSVHDLDLVGQEVRAMADVRTLDALRKPEESGPYKGLYRELATVPDVDRGALTGLLWTEAFYGATPDEARAKAAAWVRSQK